MTEIVPDQVDFAHGVFTPWLTRTLRLVCLLYHVDTLVVWTNRDKRWDASSLHKCSTAISPHLAHSEIQGSQTLVSTTNASGQTRTLYPQLSLSSTTATSLFSNLPLVAVTLIVNQAPTRPARFRLLFVQMSFQHHSSNRNHSFARVLDVVAVSHYRCASHVMPCRT